MQGEGGWVAGRVSCRGSRRFQDDIGEMKGCFDLFRFIEDYKSLMAGNGKRQQLAELTTCLVGVALCLPSFALGDGPAPWLRIGASMP